MSWQNVNQILGLAMIDAKFARGLLANPLEAARGLGFDLTEKEERILSEVKASDVSELSQILLERFSQEDQKA